MKKIFTKKAIIALLLAILATSLPITAFAESGELLGEDYAVSNVGITKNQQNIVDRGNYMYDITWVAQQTVTGWGGTFYAGNTYHIPYGQPIYSGQYIGYEATVDEFLNAAATAGSIFYTVKSYYEGPTAPYYVTDCSSYVSWAWGISRTTTYFIPDVATSMGAVTVNRATYTLQPGDALNSDSHVVLVTDLKYDESGAITQIEITEQTPPQMKRTYHTPSSLYNKYSGFTIYRYYGDVPEAPAYVKSWVENATFDTMVYRDRNPDLAHLSDEELRKHWFETGIDEGRGSSPVFDIGFYLANNSDLKAAYGNDYRKIYEHFVMYGYKEKRKSSALFDGQYYCDHYPEAVEKYGDDYMRHYVEHGILAGHRASLTFDPDYYWVIKPEVWDAWPAHYELCAKHYAGYGVREGVEAYDNQDPVISDVKITNVSSAGYTITCKVTDNWGIEYVAFPTWTIANDQDDLAADFLNTQRGTNNGDIYTFTVKASAHNNEQGEYVTHIYAEDLGGNLVSLPLNNVNVKDGALDRITLISTSDYTVKNKKLENVKPATTVNALLKQFENTELSVVDSNGNKKSGSDKVGTGARVNLYNGNVLMDSVTVIVLGDVDGNANIDATDYLRIKSAFLGGFKMYEAEFSAADVDKNNVIEATDYLRVKAQFLGTYNLF